MQGLNIGLVLAWGLGACILSFLGATLLVPCTVMREAGCYLLTKVIFSGLFCFCESYFGLDAFVVYCVSGWVITGLLFFMGVLGV